MFCKPNSFGVCRVSTGYPNTALAIHRLALLAGVMKNEKQFMIRQETATLQLVTLGYSIEFYAF